MNDSPVSSVLVSSDASILSNGGYGFGVIINANKGSKIKIRVQSGSHWTPVIRKILFE